jgi:serine/threonine protein kinase
VVLYCCAVGQFPFYDVFLGDLFVKILTLEPNYPQEMNPDLKDLIQNMLNKDPTDRISLSGIREHPFLNGFDFDLLGKLLRTRGRAGKLTSISEMAAAREAELLPYAPLAILEKTDVNKIDDRSLETVLTTTKQGVASSDPLKLLAARSAKGNRPRRQRLPH